MEKRKVKIIYSANPKSLEKELQNYRFTATVEAEYGGIVVCGNCITLAHHSNGWEKCSCPCLFDYNGFKDVIEVIGISHLDLDTLGGIAGIIGHPIKNKTFESFWTLVAFVDINGPHRIEEIKSRISNYDDVYKYINAYWAWDFNNRVNWKRDDSVYDVTEDVFERLDILSKILIEKNNKLITNGVIWNFKQQELNENTFVKNYGNVILRKSDKEFVNHLYNCPDGQIGKCVIGYREGFKSITLSFERPIEELDASEIMKEKFGNEAGGHKTIAGTPRNQEYSFDDAIKLAEYVETLFRK